MSKVQITKLPNGIRVVSDYVPDVESVAIGIWTGVGTRDEDMSHNGVAHMVEHMLFKGTKTRDMREIAESLENVGGHMNAYTSREITSYHAHVLKEHTGLALDVLGDMYLNATLPEEEIERERGVILQEIGMSLDTPDDLVFDKFHETAHPGQTIGAPILGTADIVASLPRDVMTGYIQKFYTPSRTAISAAGNIRHEDLVRQAEKLFGAMAADKASGHTAPRYSGGENRLEKPLEQSHIVLGFQGVNRLDPDYYSAQALSNILGGGMSSRLFQEVREKRGLVYSIFSFHSGYRDDGLFGVYAGTGPEKLEELIPVICTEMANITDSLKPEEVERAKIGMKSGLLMSRESMMSRVDMQAKYAIYRDKALDINQIIAAMDAVNIDSIAQTARRIFSSELCLAALGPLDRLETYDAIKQRLAA